MAKVTAENSTTGSSGRLELGEKEKRWITVGIAMHTILAPVFRAFVEPSMKQVYDPDSARWQNQSSTMYLNSDPNSKFPFNYESVNGNQGKNRKLRDYRIKDHHEYAKLHLKPHMAMFTSLGDTSCDLSALLTIIVEASVYAVDLRDSAKSVRDEVRNPWGHCHIDEWDIMKYSTCFTLMSSLVKELGIDKEKENEALDDLKNCQKKGLEICFRNSTDIEGITELKGFVQILTTSISQQHDDVHKKLDKLKGTIDLKLFELDNEVTNLKSSQKKIGMQLDEQSESISQLSIRQTSHGDRLKELENSGASNDPWSLFENLGKIGHGKFAKVFRVKHKRDGKEYALKKTHIPPKGKDMERCRREIEAISKLSDPRIVRYFGCFEDRNKKVYIQLELCGNDLNVCLDNQETRSQIRPQAVNLFEQLVKGIEVIHGEGLIHRDLKPSNIFITFNEEDVRVKIGDFGLVSFEDDEMTSCTGAPLYRAPEQEESGYNNKVDIYTLGIVLFEVLKKEVEGQDHWKKCVRRLRKETGKTLKEFEPYEPKGWKQLIDNLLREDPDERPTAKNILETFSAILDGKSQSLVNETEKLLETEPKTQEISQALSLPKNPEELIPRKYQTELALPGLEGNNSIICAPTGCGKTIVAIMIIKGHIQKCHDDNRPFKVLFLANDVRLVIQQEKRLKDYLPPDLKIECMSGDDTSEIPFSERFKRNHILIVTPQIVLNSLQKKRIKIVETSLIVLDECHHTDKGHPYMEIMLNYLTVKINSAGTTQLPQIVGLTASIGVGSGKTCLGATAHVIKICSHLDAKMLMTVKENREELLTHSNSPDSNVLDVPKRPADGDIFMQVMKQLMQNIEEKVSGERLQVPTAYADRLNAPSKGTQGYTQWSTVLGELGAKLCNKLIVSCASNLITYNEALQLYEDLRLCDAQKHLRQFVDKKRRGGYDQTDAWLDITFEAAMLRIKQDTDLYGQPVNPKLQTLSNYLLKIYGADRESKVIIFTTTRVHTIAITEWLKENKDLEDFVKPGRLVGANSPDEYGGITRNEQLLTIEKFRRGDLNILVSTDAAREGIDIPDCNAVITYSHKTNVIGMVQKRGRARAKLSEYAVIGEESSGSRVRENINLVHESMMYRAVQEIQLMQEHHPNDYDEKILKMQKDIVTKFTAKQEQKSSSSNPPPDDMDILCKECSTFVIHASSLRTVFDTNHTSNEDFSSKFTTLPYSKPNIYYTEIDGKRQKSEERYKIFCCKCGSDWGVMMNFSGINLPVIKIRSLKCRMKDKLTLKDTIAIYKKWKDFPYDIPPQDLINFPAIHFEE